MKIIFAGTPLTAVPCLDELNEHFDITAVLTRPDAPVGRGKKLAPSPIKARALELGLPIYESTASLLEALRSGNVEAELGAIVAYGEILRADVLEALPKGWINLHYSLLPKYRGAAPVQRAILNGEVTTGVTVFRLTEGLDDGPVIIQAPYDIAPDSTSGNLLNELSALGRTVLREAVEAFDGQVPETITQSSEGVSVAKKLLKSDAQIVWPPLDLPESAREAAIIQTVQKINAFSPNPGAWFEIEPPGKPALRIVVLKARVRRDESGRASIELVEVKPAGKKAMPAKAWLNGLKGVELPFTS